MYIWSPFPGTKLFTHSQGCSEPLGKFGAVFFHGCVISRPLKPNDFPVKVRVTDLRPPAPDNDWLSSYSCWKAKNFTQPEQRGIVYALHPAAPQLVSRKHRTLLDPKRNYRHKERQTEEIRFTPKCLQELFSRLTGAFLSTLENATESLELLSSSKCMGCDPSVLGLIPPSDF